MSHSSSEIHGAVFGLLACFYVFNISYSNCKSILIFLEQTLLGIGRGQTLVSVTSFINALMKYR